MLLYANMLGVLQVTAASVTCIWFFLISVKGNVDKLMLLETLPYLAMNQIVLNLESHSIDSLSMIMIRKWSVCIC